MQKEPKVSEINGALVALYQIEGLKTVGINVQIKAGSWYEGKEKWGIAHLLEHMMFQGTERFVDREAMEIFKEEYGIYSNAATGGSLIEVTLRMPSQSLKEGLELVKEMLFKAIIGENELAKQKKVVAQEYEDRMSRPGARFWKKEVKQFFGEGHLYARDGIGLKECFENTTREELLAYMKKMFVPANMVIGIAGSFEVEKVENYLKEMLPVGGEKSKITFDEVKPDKDSVTHYEEGMSTAMIRIGWLTKGMEKTTLEERIRVRLASYLLGGSTRSIFFKEIREKMGLAYGISTGTEYYPTVGWFDVDTSVKAENIEMAIEEIERLLKEFIDKPMDKTLLERAKKYLMMQKQMAYESALGTAGSLAAGLFWQGRIISAEEYQSILEGISEKEVRQAIKEIVSEKEPMVAVMRSK